MAFAKPAQLCKRTDYLHVQQTGVKFRGRHLLLIANSAANSGIGTGRVGFTVSRRVGGAVVRNLVKRRLRAIWRQHVTTEPMTLDVVIIALPMSASAPFAHLSQDVACLLRKALARVPVAASSASISGCSPR